MVALKLVTESSRSPYQEVGARYIDAGYSALPINPGTKVPGAFEFRDWKLMFDWTRFCDRRPTAIETEIWNGWPDAGVCVATGFKGLVAIDIDTDNSEVMAAIISVLPDSPVGKKGAKGKTLFYRCNVDSETGCAVASRPFDVNGERVLDLLAYGKQTVLPPTIHPKTGQPYHWLGTDTLADVSIESLPLLPDNIAELLATALEPFGYVEPVGREYTQTEGGDSYWRDLNQAALANLELWVRALGLPKTRKSGAGFRAVAAWRGVKDTNLAFHPDGIKDWGTNEGYSPIDVVVLANGLDFNPACDWLAEKLKFQKEDDAENKRITETLISNAKLSKSKLQHANDNTAKPPSAVKAVAITDDSINAETLLGIDFPPLEYVIPGYLVEGLTVLGGRPKLGKSWLAYDASIAVATGRKAMGSVACEQGDVLYLALEDNRRRVKDRLLTLCPARKLLKINLDRLTVRTVAPRIDTGLIAELDKWRLGCKRPRLIIIDVFLKVRPPRKKGEDPYSADYDAVTPLQRYASEHRLAIVLVTHTRKMQAEDPLEAINGTNGITGAADTVLVLNRDATGTTLYGRGRDIEEIETAMKFDGGRWAILGDADEVRKSDERRKIVAALKDSSEEIGPKAIAEATGMKADNVRKLLRKMVASGEIAQPRVGFYTVPFSKPPEE